MSIKEKLMEDLKLSMKNKDVLRKNTVTMVRAAIKQVEVDERRELGDDEITAIIGKQLKERRFARGEFEKGNRSDLVEQTDKEIDILLEYLPEQLSEEELTLIVRECIDEAGAKSTADIGKIMKLVMPKVQGRADGKQVNEIIKRIFSA